MHQRTRNKNERSMTVKFEGGCLCGSVRFISTAMPTLTVHCCCKDCQKLSGTTHSTHSVVTADAFIIKGQTSSYEKIADSGNLIVRRFCPNCASPIYHTREGLAGKIILRTSSMDEPEHVKPDKIIYHRSAISWGYFDPTLPRFDTMS